MLRLRAQASIALQAGRLRQDWGGRGVRLGLATVAFVSCTRGEASPGNCFTDTQHYSIDHASKYRRIFRWN